MLRLGALRVAAGLALLAAAAPGSAAAQTVGTAAAVNPQVQGGERVLQVGSSIIFRERVSTSANGSTQVIFVDKTVVETPPLRLDFLQQASIAFLAIVVLFLGVFPGGLVWKITSSLP